MTRGKECWKIFEEKRILFYGSNTVTDVSGKTDQEKVKRLKKE